MIKNELYIAKELNERFREFLERLYGLANAENSSNFIRGGSMFARVIKKRIRTFLDEIDKHSLNR